MASNTTENSVLTWFQNGAVNGAVAPGRALSITLEACDMDTTLEADTVSVIVVATTASGDQVVVTDTERIILTETAQTSGFSQHPTFFVLNGISSTKDASLRPVD